MINAENRSSWHVPLLMGAFVLALGLRLIRLGVMPLTDMEAEIALQALGVARGTKTLFGPDMTTVGLTGVNFFIFTSSNFLVRLWPAVIGALIVFLPFLFREKLGHWPATITSFILALSPEMVGLSRMIGSPMISMACLLLTLGLLNQKKPILAGITLALGLMSGPSFWLGLIILGLSLALSEKFFNIYELFPTPFLSRLRDHWVRLGSSFLLTLILVSTSFFITPSGISGIFSGLAVFIKGFGGGYTSPIFLLPLSLIIYVFPALVFGIWGGIRGIFIKSKPDLFLMVWWLLGFLVILIYPGSEPADMIWVSLPLWILSARVLFFTWRLPDKNRLIMAFMTIMVVVLAAFMLLALRSLANPTLSKDQQVNTIIAILGGGVLVVAIVLLVNFGWAEDVALAGFLLGLVIVFGLALISQSVNSTSLGSKDPISLWYPSEPILSTEWLTVSIDRILDWNKKSTSAVEIAVSDFETPGMMWLLHHDQPVQFVAFLNPQSQPGIIITGDQDNPELTSSYRGQDLTWSREVLWEAMSPYQYFTWSLTGEAPTHQKQIIFWARTDLMPDEQFSP